VDIVIGSDHAGFELKGKVVELLRELKHEVEDVGCHSNESVDYPDFAEKLTAKLEGTGKFGILICGTGIGMSIAANRHRFIRAALCHDEHTAIVSREHNNANVLCLGARILDSEAALGIVKVWLETDFAGGRHQQRISKFSDM